jgi:hypothetical protein
MTMRRGEKAVGWVFLSLLLFTPLSLSAADRLQIRLEDSCIVYWEIRVSEPFTFSLRHRNSIFDVWVEERFRIDHVGRIHLIAVRTSSPAVLEYYGLEEASADWIPFSRSFDKISLLVSKRGRTSLRFDQDVLLLSDQLPEGTRIGIRVFPEPE